MHTPEAEQEVHTGTPEQDQEILLPDAADRDMVPPLEGLKPRLQKQGLSPSRLRRPCRMQHCSLRTCP